MVLATETVKLDAMQNIIFLQNFFQMKLKDDN